MIKLYFIKIFILVLLILILFMTNTLAEENKELCDCKPLRNLSLHNPLMEGDDIWELQQQLKDLGFYKGEINSIYDWQTYLAVRNFQYTSGLKETGIVKEELWVELAEALNKRSTITATNKRSQAPEGKVSLLINGYKRQMTVLSDGEAYYSFPVAIGKASTKSPIGEWAIIAKDKDWGGGFGVRWMRLNVPWGIYGIHGTNKPGSIGSAASHGCIRMFNRDVKVLYDWVEVGTRVKIIGRRDKIEINHDLKPRNVGADVLLFQEKLRGYGFNPGYTDGRFGGDTKKAMEEFKYIYGLKDDLEGDQNSFYILNIQ
ncbi:L,D-transpeptidase family protein [Orenia marismortui]|uniref:L,D-transpeptidase family protein n=1 Tax=Orenia marismortui TaxID=46469 RepID=UPI001FBBA65C|nr:peptidoglycan-binding protein [Orenia marismortui]